MLTKKQRLKAIFNCLWFGILPSYIYEKECHYKKHGDGENAFSYFDHLKLNMIILKCLIFKTEHECTHSFHKTKWKKYFRWQYK